MPDPEFSQLILMQGHNPQDPTALKIDESLRTTVHFPEAMYSANE